MKKTILITLVLVALCFACIGCKEPEPTTQKWSYTKPSNGQIWDIVYTYATEKVTVYVDDSVQ